MTEDLDADYLYASFFFFIEGLDTGNHMFDLVVLLSVG